MSFSFSKANDEAAIATGLGAFAYTYLLAGDTLTISLGITLLAALGVLGYTGYTAPAV